MKYSFENLRSDDFRKLAMDNNLSKYEKIGFPDAYRKNFEQYIFDDICMKLSRLNEGGINVLDIGPGCSDLPIHLINLCEFKQNNLILMDSGEMLSLLPDSKSITKMPSLFPDCHEWISHNAEKIDVILCYSVFHYIYLDTNIFNFLDHALSLLSPGGQILLGDIPNISKRKRFFASAAGINFHKNFMNTDSDPVVDFNVIDHNKIDDSVIFSILQRARSQGFDAYLLAQNKQLPLANRREDILITRP